MEGREILVLNHFVATESQPVDALGKDNRAVEGLEQVVLNHHTRTTLTPVEILLLSLQVRDFGIDGNHGFGELEEIRQGVDELVLTDGHVAASSRLEPSVAIAAKEDGRTRCMVEHVTLNHGLQRGAEQGATGTVVANHIVGKIDFGTPFEVFDAEALALVDGGIKRLYKADFKFLGTIDGFLVERFDGGNFILAIEDFHRVRAHELHLVALASPIEAVGLRMHISTHHGLVVKALHNLQVRAVHVDGIVHHPLVQSVARHNLALASREVGRIGLCGEVSRVVLATEADVEFLQGDVFADLRQQAHPLGIMYGHVFQTCVLIL